MNSINTVEAVEKLILAQPQIDIQTNHYLAGGVYEREIIVPAGSIVTGKIHLTEHLAKLVTGTMSIFSDRTRGTFTGPVTFVSTPGEKRVGYAHDDVVFSTFHAVGELDDINEIESLLVVDTTDEYEQYMLGQLTKTILIGDTK